MKVVNIPLNMPKKKGLTQADSIKIYTIYNCSNKIAKKSQKHEKIKNLLLTHKKLINGYDLRLILKIHYNINKNLIKNIP